MQNLLHGNLAQNHIKEIGMDKDLISRQQVIEEIKELFSMGDCYCDEYAIVGMLNTIPSVQPEQYKIGYSECANAMLMWINNMLTDEEYRHIIDKLNAHWAERSKKHVNVNT